jgi:putative PIN family toxin of toxin-antitoxin system
MNVVLDTNVLIAAFITQGVCSNLLEQVIRWHVAVTSDFILEEFREKLVGKFHYSADTAAEAVELLRFNMKVVVPEKLENSVCRDPDDDVVLSTALMGRAVCIITGDKDLLVIKRFQGIDILRPSEFAEYEATRDAESG